MVDAGMSPEPIADRAQNPSRITPALAWYGVGMVSLVTLFGQLDRGVMALLVTSIKRDTGMSDTQLSLLLGAAYSVVYMLAGLPMARVADSGRRTLLLPAALAVWSLGTALCGLAQSFWSFFVFRGIVGAGEAVKTPTSTSLIADLVRPHHYPRAFALYNLAVSFGESGALILGGLALGYVLQLGTIEIAGIALHGWRLVYLIFGIPGLLVALIFTLTLREPPRQGRRFAGAAPIREIARFMLTGLAGQMYIPAFIAAALMSLYAFGSMAWRPAFYERTYGLMPTQYGPLVGTLGLIIAPIGIPLGAFLVERMQRRWADAYMRIVVITDALTIPFAIAGPLMPRYEYALACFVGVNLLMTMSVSSKLAAQQVVAPNEMRAQINAVMMFTVSVLGTGLGPIVIALTSDLVFPGELGLRYAMALAATVATPLILICSILGMRAYGRLVRSGLVAA